VFRTVAPLTLLFLLLAWLCSAEASAQELRDLGRAHSLAMEGDRAYEAGDFAAAAKLYQDSIEVGLDHEIVHYNLGNAHYKQGEVGLAIASYLRALRRNPRDENARANLMQARTFLRDEALAPLNVPVFLRPLQWVYRRGSLNDWGWLGLGGLSLVTLILVVGHWIAAVQAVRVRIVSVCAAASLACFLMMGVHFVREEMRATAVVVAEEVDVRSGPGPGYNLSFKIHEGLEVFVDDRRQEWVQIHLGGELVGWVRAEDVTTL